MLSKTQTKSSPKIAIIGGGIAGATAAVHMAELGLDVHLIEKGNGSSVVRQYVIFMLVEICTERSLLSSV